MRVHYFQHVSFEGLGSIEPWMKLNAAQVSATKFFEDPHLPGIHEIDWLIVMGGPMSSNDEQLYPWLHAEKEFIAEAIRGGKIVLGVCLGAQLIASALGARVYPNRNREIGWYPIECLGEGEKTSVKNIIPSPLEVFHWHSETFDLPAQAVHLARSEGCTNQAFCIGERVVGLQFHLEATPLTVKSLTEHCRSDLVPGSYVQFPAEMLSAPLKFQRINAVMNALLDHWNTFENKDPEE